MSCCAATCGHGAVASEEKRRLTAPGIGVAVDLITGAPQTWHAIAIYVAFLGQELINRDVVEAARFLDRHPTAAYGFDDSRLPPRRPPLSGNGSCGT